MTQTDSATQAARREREGRRQNAFAEYAVSLLVTVILALYGTTFVVQAFKIPSQSMEPALLVGDHLLVNKFLFGGNGAWYDRLLPYRPLRRGDIVVFKYPYEDHPYYVKRVIGLPGDGIRIADQQVYVNGKRLEEPYVVHDPGAADPYMFDFPPTQPNLLLTDAKPEWVARMPKFIRNGELVVPPLHYFMMGDNRDHSWDSRYWGFVDRDAIMGRPFVIYWSVEASNADYIPAGLWGDLEGTVETLLHLPSRTRWGRMFHEVH